MAASVKIESFENVAGKPPQVFNRPIDCPTMIVDGLNGATLSAHMVRLHLVEHVGYEQDSFAKFVLNLAFDAEQFGKFVDTLVAIREQIAPQSAEGA